MELIPFRRKSDPPTVKSPHERAFDSLIEAQNCDIKLRKTVAYYCMVQEAVCLLFVLSICGLAAVGYIPLAFVLAPVVYAVVKVRGKNFDRVVENIFHRRE